MSPQGQRHVHQLVVIPIWLKLMKKTTIPRRQRFDGELMLQKRKKTDYVETIGKAFVAKEGHRSVEERWVRTEDSSTGVNTETPTR